MPGQHGKDVSKMNVAEGGTISLQLGGKIKGTDSVRAESAKESDEVDRRTSSAGESNLKSDVLQNFLWDHKVRERVERVPGKKSQKEEKNKEDKKKLTDYAGGVTEPVLRQIDAPICFLLRHPRRHPS